MMYAFHGPFICYNCVCIGVKNTQIKMLLSVDDGAKTKIQQLQQIACSQVVQSFRLCGFTVGF